MNNYSINLKSITFFALVILFFTLFTNSYAQHHGGTQAPPISFGDGEVTVNTSIYPHNFIPEKDANANLKVRFFDTASGSNIPNVTYRVQIYSGEQLLANQTYFDSDGELDINIKPRSGCEEKLDLWRCTTYEGEMDPIVPSAFASTDKSTPVIKGPVFDKSGTYTVKVAIIGATNPKTQIDKDINFETNIMIAQEQQLSLGVSSDSVPILVRDYHEKTSSLQFDEESNSITMEIPLSEGNTVHAAMIKNEIAFPKTFEPFNEVSSFSGFVNGVPLLPKALHFDKTSDKTDNILHIMVSSNEVQSLKEKISATDNFSLVIIPNSEEFLVHQELKFDNGYSALTSVDTRHSESKDTVFSVAFFDTSGNLVENVRYAYGIKDPNGEESLNMGGSESQIGLKLPDGTDMQTISTPTDGNYNLKLVLIGTESNDFENYMYQDFSFDMINFNMKEFPVTQALSNIESKPISKASEINGAAALPDWVKNNAKWWAEGQIDDNSFIQGIQNLIEQDLITIVETDSKTTLETEAGLGSSEIPAWIKNNAGWWADGQISESDFLKGIEHLISIGIIKLD